MPTPTNEGYLLTLDLCFLDVETTGSVFGYHEIIDVAAIRTDSNGRQVYDTWRRKVRPLHPERISDFARTLTGFSADVWKSAAPADPEFWQSFAAFAKGCVPVCHNPSFDRAFITLSAIGAGIYDLGLDYHWIGTESLAWPLYRRGEFPKLSLASLCEFLGLEIEKDPHEALGGAEACRRVYLALLARF